MLMRSDPFRELDRLTQQVLGTRMRPAGMPLDAYRRGAELVAHLDVPGVDPGSIDLTVENNVLTVAAERQWTPGDDVQVIASERPQGTFRRQLFLGDGLDPDRVRADYADGVLTITIPVAERAKPRRVEVASSGDRPAEVAATTSAA